MAVFSAPLQAQLLPGAPFEKLEQAVTGGPPSQEQIAAAKQEVRDMSQNALSRLASLSPGARRAVDRAPGYAVFSAFGLKILVAGGNTGKGVVFNRGNGQQTFMRMVQVQAGLGFGIAENQLIFVFTTEQALRNFIDQGWEFGGQANLSAMAQDDGSSLTGAASVAPGVYLYQLTETGLSATLTVAGTKFFRDPDLN
jgi:lipid-binding SYLF domain-containing protein